MCLGIPGKVISIAVVPPLAKTEDYRYLGNGEENSTGMAMGKVSFGGIAKEVCLVYVPEVQVGDYVIVHAGFALNVLNEEEANEVFDLLSQMESMAELEMPE